MAASVHGTAHLYGVDGTLSNATILNVSLGNEFALSDTTVNESGVVIERRFDDRTVNGTVTIRIRTGYTAPLIGAILTVNAVKYILTALTHDEESQGYRTQTYTLIRSEGVDIDT